MESPLGPPPMMMMPRSISEYLSVGTRPGFKVTLVMLFFFIKGDVGERLVWDELFLFGIFSGEIEVGVPCAGIEVDLITDNIIEIERDGLVMMSMSVDDITCAIIHERRFFQCEFCEGMIAARYASVLQLEDEVINGLERDELGNLDRQLHFVDHIETEFVFAFNKIQSQEILSLLLTKSKVRKLSASLSQIFFS